MNFTSLMQKVFKNKKMNKIKQFIMYILVIIICSVEMAIEWMKEQIKKLNDLK